MRRRILIITRNLPPLVGGMERLNWHMAEELAKRADVRVVGPQRATACAPEGVSVCEVPLRPLSRFLVTALSHALRQARVWRPQIVLAGSGLTAPLAWLAARMVRARAAVYLHGLDMAVRHPVYWALWLPAIRRMDCVIANSRATARLATDAGVDSARIGVVHPGVSLPPEGQGLDAARRFREEHGFGDRPLLLSVGRLTRRKGLREFVSQVLPRVLAQKPDVLLIVIGDAPADALHAEFQTPESIQAVADAKGIGKHLLFLGRVSEDELAAVYRAANVHVFPIQPVPDDPEGFGMVAVEAAAHGLSTVAYATGGVIDAVANDESGYLVQPDDDVAFAKAVIRLLDQPLSVTTLRAYAEKFAWIHFGEKLWSLLSRRESSNGIANA